MQNIVSTVWKENMEFESVNPSGLSLIVDDGKVGYKPKALMLSSLAGCSGLDVVSLLKKMRVVIDEFEIKITGHLTDEHPKIYNKVKIDYNFKGSNLQSDKIRKAVNLSATKYCGVMEMFRKFAEVNIEIFIHEQ